VQKFGEETQKKTAAYKIFASRNIYGLSDLNARVRGLKLLILVSNRSNRINDTSGDICGHDYDRMYGPLSHFTRFSLGSSSMKTFIYNLLFGRSQD